MSKLPEAYERVRQQNPEVMKYYEALGKAARDTGPLDAKAIALVKVGMCIGAGLEGGTHASVRKALKTGYTPDELRHAAVLAVTTLGFPAMSRAKAWVEDVLAQTP